MGHLSVLRDRTRYAHPDCFQSRDFVRRIYRHSQLMERSFSRVSTGTKPVLNLPGNGRKGGRVWNLIARGQVVETNLHYRLVKHLMVYW